MSNTQAQSSLPATSVTTGKVRLSFVNIFEPRSMNQDGTGEKKYSVLVMIPKTDKVTIDKVTKAIEAAKQAAKDSKWGGKIPAVVKTTFKDADKDVNQSGEIYSAVNEEQKGHFIINVSSKNRPGIVDANMQEIIDPAKVYSGCYGKVNMNFFGYKHATGGVGISAGLQHVMFLEDGDPLSGRVSAEAAFA